MHYVLIGNSLVSVKIAEELRQADPEGEITLFCPEGVLPYQRHLLPSLLVDPKTDKIACASEDFYKANRIQVVTDKKIAKVHPKRKRILTEDKEHIPFDVLFLEHKGAPVFSDLKGSQKQGVFHLKTFSDAQKLSAYLGLCETATIEIHDIAALQAACHLHKLNKNVIALVPGGHLLSDLIDKDVADHLTEQLQRSGMRFIFNNAIVEVLGDSEVKAIRLKTGKVLESQLVLLAPAGHGSELLNTEELSKEETDHCLRYEDVYCAKDLKAVLDRFVWDDALIDQYALTAHAKNIVASFLHREPTAITAPAERSVIIGEESLCLLGSCKKEEAAVAYMKADYAKNMYAKVFVQDGIVKGAALINAPAARDGLLGLIRAKANIADQGIGILGL